MTASQPCTSPACGNRRPCRPVFQTWAERRPFYSNRLAGAASLPICSPRNFTRRHGLPALARGLFIPGRVFIERPAPRLSATPNR